MVGSLAAGLAAAACGSDGGTSPTPANAGGSDGGAATTDDGSVSNSEGGTPLGPDGGPVGTSCPRTLAAADRARKAVVSHPYVEGGGSKADLFEVLDYSTAGVLTKTGDTFHMKPAYTAVQFTPDGKIGIVAQDDGTLGVFTFDDAGKPTVIHAAFQGAFYAAHVVISPDGTRAFVLDQQTENNHGGVYQVAIGCDGTLTDQGLVVPGGTAHAMAFLPGDSSKAILAGGKALTSPPSTYAHELDFSGAAPQLLANGAVFPDDNAIASWIAITPDSKFAVITDDNSLADGAGNRMSAVALDTLTALPPIATDNPAAIVMSPFGNAALLLNSDGTDALHVVKYDPSNATKPFEIGAEVAYVGGKTQLPTLPVVFDRGALKGRVLVSEVSAIRQLTFNADGSVTDQGLFEFGDASADIVGSFGLQP